MRTTARRCGAFVDVYTPTSKEDGTPVAFGVSIGKATLARDHRLFRCKVDGKMGIFVRVSRLASYLGDQAKNHSLKGDVREEFVKAVEHTKAAPKGEYGATSEPAMKDGKIMFKPAFMSVADRRPSHLQLAMVLASGHIPFNFAEDPSLHNYSSEAPPARQDDHPGQARRAVRLRQGEHHEGDRGAQGALRRAPVGLPHHGNKKKKSPAAGADPAVLT